MNDLHFYRWNKLIKVNRFLFTTVIIIIMVLILLHDFVRKQTGCYVLRNADKYD